MVIYQLSDDYSSVYLISLPCFEVAGEFEESLIYKWLCAKSSGCVQNPFAYKC